ncbi:TolC family protein [Burkholderia sp. Ac-20379]|uniref:TolC family protein n=1 Tax=Burkholderia sp. Ac-20379 TaxID=2703900 RepID=UPI00197EB497|nr:TolC family protein [Burkholderia sp. Ac-20379]MBN3726554.1 TolC family protein [Burkholderia sp. Ac-20379]
MPFTIGTPARRRARTRSCAVLFAFGLLSGRAAHAEDTGLTLDEALHIATSRSSSIQAAQAAVRGSADVVVKAGQLPNPTLNLGVQDLPINGPNAVTIGQDNFTMRGIGIQQEWVSPEKRRLRTALAERTVERDTSTYLEKVAEVRQQAAMAWLNAIYAKQAVTLNRALVDHLSQELAARQASYRGAKGTAVDVAQAGLTLGNARDELIGAQQDEKTALITLSRWTGAGNVLEVAGTPPEPESRVAGLSPDQLARVQPALIAARAAVSLADADTDIARSNRSPNWTWGLTYFKSGGRFPDYVSAGVTIPLPVHRGSVEDRDVEQKSEMGTQARLTYEDTARQVAADIRSLAVRLASGRERLANARQTILPVAEQKMQLADAAYRSGAGTLSDALDARHTRLEADLQVLKLQRDVSLIWAQLEYQVLPPDLISGQ